MEFNNIHRTILRMALEGRMQKNIIKDLDHTFFILLKKIKELKQYKLITFKPVKKSQSGILTTTDLGKRYLLICDEIENELKL